MTTGQLDAIDAQRRTQALDQIGLQQTRIFKQQAHRQQRPAALYDFGVALKELAHGA